MLELLTQISYQDALTHLLLYNNTLVDKKNTFLLNSNCIIKNVIPVTDSKILN